MYFSASVDGVLSAKDLYTSSEKRGVETRKATDTKKRRVKCKVVERNEIETKEWHEQLTLMQYVHANVLVCFANVCVCLRVPRQFADERSCLRFLSLSVEFFSSPFSSRHFRFASFSAINAFIVTKAMTEFFHSILFFGTVCECGLCYKST